MKKIFLLALTAASVAASFAHANINADKSLPMPFETVFSMAMDDPNVMLYHADQSFRSGDYVKALTWMLKASEYEHPAAISNTKFMIQNNFGTFENRVSVVDFLEYYAEPRGDQPADMFARVYLADYYRGDKCVWFSPEDKSECMSNSNEPMAGFDLRQSYYYYEGAATQGNDRAIYTMSMMNLLGLGVPRNVPLALSSLKKLSEKGSIAASEIVAQVYQQGYWIPQDKDTASKYFKQPLSVGIPTSLLTMAGNYEAGFAGDNEKERMQLAVRSYNRVLTSSISSVPQKAEAALKTSLLLSTYEPLLDKSKSFEMLGESVEYGIEVSNEYSVKALMLLGDMYEMESLTKAVATYKRAISMLESLPLNERQRHAVVYQKVGYAYASSEGDLGRDERLFSFYMNQHHKVMSQTFIPDIDFTVFAGYSAYNFPG